MSEREQVWRHRIERQHDMQPFPRGVRRIVDRDRAGPSLSLIFGTEGQHIAVFPFRLDAANHGHANRVFPDGDPWSAAHAERDLVSRRKVHGCTERLPAVAGASIPNLLSRAKKTT